MPGGLRGARADGQTAMGSLAATPCVAPAESALAAAVSAVCGPQQLPEVGRILAELLVDPAIQLLATSRPPDVIRLVFGAVDWLLRVSPLVGPRLERYGAGGSVIPGVLCECAIPGEAAPCCVAVHRIAPSVLVTTGCHGSLTAVHIRGQELICGRTHHTLRQGKLLVESERLVYLVSELERSGRFEVLERPFHLVPPPRAADADDRTPTGGPCDFAPAGHVGVTLRPPVAGLRELLAVCWDLQSGSASRTHLYALFCEGGMRVIFRVSVGWSDEVTSKEVCAGEAVANATDIFNVPGTPNLLVLTQQCLRTFNLETGEAQVVPLPSVSLPLGFRFSIDVEAGRIALLSFASQDHNVVHTLAMPAHALPPQPCARACHCSWRALPNAGAPHASLQ